MLVRHLDEIIGTDREIDGGTWVSRRLVLAKDKVDFSFHDTIVRAGTETPTWHKYHYESLYCIEGEGELVSPDSGETRPITPGTLILLDKHDPHILRAKTDLRVMSVFAPPLTGREVLDEQGAFPLLSPRRALRKRNIFVIGLNGFNLRALEAIRNAENYEYLPLLSPEDVLEQTEYDIDALLAKARAQLSAFPDMVDGLIHYIDFPVSTSVPILCREVFRSHEVM